jgi:hypothetical protein
MNYGEIFSKAWKIIKKFKVLWVLGFLAGCGASSAGGNAGGNSGYQFSNGDYGNHAPHYFNQFSYNLNHWFHNLINEEQVFMWALAAIAVIIVVCFCLGLLTLVLRTIGRGGLARGAWDADEGYNKLTFGGLWKSGVKIFWKVLLFTLLMWLINFGLSLLLIIPVVALTLGTLFCGLIFIIPALIVLNWMMTAWYELGVVAIVGDSMEVMEGFRRSWNILWKNFWKVLLTALIVFVGTFVATLILIVPMLLVAVPAFIGYAVQNPVAITVGWIVAGVFFLIYLAAVIIAGAGIKAYTGTVWVLLYRRLTGRMGVDLCSVEPPAPVIEAEETPKEEKPVELEKPAQEEQPKKVVPDKTRVVAEPLPNPDKTE